MNTTYGLDWNDLLRADYTENLAIELEGMRNIKDGPYGQVYSGYYKAPATGRHRFYMTCDDSCQLYLSTTPNDPSKATRIYQSDGHTSFRNYLLTNEFKQTQWISLEKDEFYYIEVRHIQGTGGDHFSVAVEIEDFEAPNGHHHSMKEI